jgi:hypothetical protein
MAGTIYGTMTFFLGGGYKNVALSACMLRISSAYLSRNGQPGLNKTGERYANTYTF